MRVRGSEMNKRRGLIRLAIAWTVFWNASWIGLRFWADREAQDLARQSLRYVEATFTNEWIEKGIVDQGEFDATLQATHDRVDNLRAIADAALPWGLSIWVASLVLAGAIIWIVAGFKPDRAGTGL